jgi:hypothetical protein
MGIIGYKIGLESLGGGDSRFIDETADLNELIASSQTSALQNDPLVTAETTNQIGNYSNEVIIT